jgi:hypothetical protein
VGKTVRHHISYDGNRLIGLFSPLGGLLHILAYDISEIAVEVGIYSDIGDKDPGFSVFENTGNIIS